MIETLGNLGDFIGGIAVIGSLIYLAIQIRSNTKSNQAQALSQWATFSSFTIDHMIRDREFVELLQRFLSSDDWTQDDPDTIRVSMFLVQMFQNLQTIFYIQQSGTIGEEFLEAQVPYIDNVLSQPGGKHWWHSAGEQTFTPQFVTFIRQRIT
ncbi:MAG: hypothetical protein ACFHX7_15645 [Pseudomonadota bacterium]